MDFKLTPGEISALRSIQDKCYGQAVSIGWHEKPREFGTLIALAHTELSEAMEGFRKSARDKHLKGRKAVEVELADCMIRILDIAGRENLDVAGAFAEKHSYNGVRKDHKREVRAKRGGKKI